MNTQSRLNNDSTIPNLGMGTWSLKSDVARDAVAYGITKIGYRHIDCASIYDNEPAVGEGLAEALASGIKREDLFVTSKLWNTEHNPGNVEAACRQTLKDLQLDYLDLYLMHWGIAFPHGGDPEPLGPDGIVLTENVSLQATWQAMEQLVEKGLVKSIGVSNFSTPMVLDLLTYAKIQPVMNQIELHPYLPEQHLVEFCASHGIACTAYSPFGMKGPHHFDEPVIAELAKKYGKTPGQILLNWAIARGTIVIPRSSNHDRLAENFDIFNFELAADEQAKITALDKGRHLVDPYDWWKVPYFD